MSSETKWQELWKNARAARESGRISEALSLYSATLNAAPPIGELFFEIGSFVASLWNNLAGLRSLEDEHRCAFGFTPQEFPIPSTSGIIGGDGWRFAIDALARAVELQPREMKWRAELAAALERIGQHGEAIACRRETAELLNSFENGVAIARLLAAGGAKEAAASQYEVMLERWGPRPALLLPLARIYGTHDNTHKSRALVARIASTIAESRKDADRHLAFLLEFSQAAAQLRSPVDVKALAPELLPSCCAAVDDHRDALTAWLAKGYAGLATGEADITRQCFAYASLIAELSIGDDNPLSDSIREAVARARAHLLDLEPSTPGPWPYPTDARRLALVHARSRLEIGDAVGALNDYLTAIFGISARHFSFDNSAIYKRYRIMFRSGRYYAIPESINGVVFVGGKVYRVPKFLYDNRRYIPSWLVSPFRAQRSEPSKTGVRRIPIFVRVPARRAIAWAARTFLVDRAFTAGSVWALMGKINRETTPL